MRTQRIAALLAFALLAPGCAARPPKAEAPTATYRVPADWIGTSSAAEERPAAPAEVDALAVFNGKYVKTTGTDRHCPTALEVEAKYLDTHELASVKMDDETLLEPNATQRREPAAAGAVARFVEDHLQDGYAELEARNEPISPDAPKWKIQRVYSRKKTVKSPTTFSGFEVWEFVPGKSGAPEIRLRGTPSPEYRCEYKRS